ncbi:hypothetical protein SAMN03159338_1496 [Sphingomonas sp. NFR04]|uniref:hypothetical protein n=1 Tax=Sphingomonas sp. NFR04 TaxID=1566283 RepID=UPI0008F18E0E|nr:hypothetical protein [Sphingomonas sp. NFR04]SFJ47556.1 hypothetical protein SAMN03159338_1496 [Sphingomonas sp. NFR04]
MKIAELMEAARKLRLRKGQLRFRPKLIYLVDTVGGYTHPSREGYTSGQTAWADRTLWFQCHGDAKEHADKQPPWHKPKVVKLNICAFEEPIKQAPISEADEEPTE